MAEDRVMLELHGVGKSFVKRQGKMLTYTHAVRGINLAIREHEFVSIIGPSGCGKTTVLRMIAGLVPWTEGEIRIDGTPVSGPGPDRGVVFQSAGLMPWRTVVQNVELGLEQLGVPPAQRREQAMKFVERVGLQDFATHYPRELSGGMQQRVGLARALAINPKVLLMDEPFGALDAITRGHMQDELLRIWAVEKKTVVFITHDIEEALFLSDRLVVLDKNGTVKGQYEIPFARPRNREALAVSMEFIRERQRFTQML